MKEQKLHEIINKKQEAGDKELIEDKLLDAPYNQALRRLKDVHNSDNQNIHYIYDWHSYKPDEIQEESGGAPEVGKLKMNDKKKKTKRNHLQEMEKMNENIKAEKTKNDHQSDKQVEEPSKKETLKKSHSDSSIQSHWKAISAKDAGNLDPFTQWLNSMDPSQATPAKTKVKKKKKKKKLKKKSRFMEKVDSSLKVQEDIASDHLANLYVKQGHFKEALDMYEKLLLKNPEKSDFFAAQIEEIKNKLK